MKIKLVEIEAFRAYKFKKDSTFDFSIKENEISNFISIYSPNGFGKSSFYDAVEWAVTKSIKRYNHKINEEAAKATKGIGAQYIIRNKDVLENIETSVKVVTNSIHQPNYYNNFKSSSIRKTSRDYRFNEAEENLFFRRVILSQDSIDRFLKEIKPEERYRSFMEFWDEDLESSRIKITSLLQQNAYKISELQKEYKIKSSLEQESNNGFIVDEFNKIVDELNQLGENIRSISDTYDDHAEYELSSLVKRRIYEIEQEYDFSLAIKDHLNRKMLEIPDIEKKINIINQDTKVVFDLTYYLNLLKKKNILLDDLLEKTCEYHELEKLDSFVKEFENKKSSFMSNNKLRDSWLKKQDILKKEKEEIEIIIEQSKVNIKNTGQKIIDLFQCLNESKDIYERLVLLNDQVIALTAIILEKDVIQKEYIEKRENLISQIDIISKYDLDINSLMTKDMSLLCLSIERINRIKQLHNSLSVIDLQSNTILMGQNVIEQQKEIMDELISLGLNYVSKWSPEKCPLCEADYASTEELYKSIYQNDRLSDLDRKNADLLSGWEADKRKIEAQLKEELNGIIQIKSDKLITLRNDLILINRKIDQCEQEQKENEKNNKDLLEEIEELSFKVNRLSQDEFVKYVEASIKSLKDEETKIKNALVLSENILNEKSESLINCNKELFVINEYFMSIEKEDYFVQVNSFLERNHAHYTELMSLYRSKGDNVLSKKNEIDAQIKELEQEIQVVYQDIISNNALIDFNKIEEIKSDKENKVRYLKNDINIFYSSVEQLIHSNTKELNQILERIKVSIDDISVKLSIQKDKQRKFEILSNQINLAKEYFTRRKLKKEKQELEEKIVNHERVTQNLSEMLDNILLLLKERVDSFFYTDLINVIYKKIDPHPSFKSVEFMLDIDKQQPSLNIILKNEKGDIISPNLYFSSAQLNVLSLSIFLANALHAKDEDNNPIDVILIDDPIQAMDSINILSTIDLLRNISVNFGKQIIISTHNESFFRLLQKKIPSSVFDSKFFILERVGGVKNILDKSL